MEGAALNQEVGIAPLLPLKEGKESFLFIEKSIFLVPKLSIKEQFPQSLAFPLIEK